jgi:hypothetical protein
MNSTITFHGAKLFGMALNVLALEEAPAYESDSVALTIVSDDILAIETLLNDNGIFFFDVEAADENDRRDDECDQFRHDGEADGDALASAGFGTAEDYGSASEHFSDDE